MQKKYFASIIEGKCRQIMLIWERNGQIMHASTCEPLGEHHILWMTAVFPKKFRMFSLGEYWKQPHIVWYGPIQISKETQNTCITFVQRWPNVFDVGPILYKCYTSVLCLLGYVRLIVKITIHSVIWPDTDIPIVLKITTHSVIWADKWKLKYIMGCSRTHAIGFHYETYGEISSSRTPALLLSLILPFQKDIRTRKCILHRWYDKMGWSQHSSPHQALA